MVSIRIRREKMNAVFTKHHLKGLPFDAVIHHFSEKDQHEHIHDHRSVLQRIFCKGVT